MSDKSLRVLVCGGRDFNNKELLYASMDKTNYDGNIEICHGGARGADSLSGEWAKDRKVKCTVFPADWAKNGKAAGPIRNKQMLDEFKPDFVVAFYGGKGTENMMKQAQKAGVPVYKQGW